MARTLAKTVHVEHETHGRQMFLAGSVPPDWAQDFITNPKAWVTSDDDDTEPEGSGGEVKRPGKSGPGSGREAWVTYAESKGVTVDDQMSRDDIAAAVDALDS